MRQYFLATVLLTTGMAARAQNDFLVKGTLTGLKEEKRVVLSYVRDRKYIADTVIARQGTFSFTGTLPDGPLKASLSLSAIKPDPAVSYTERMLRTDEQAFYLEKGTITVKGDTAIGAAVITGGKTQTENNLLAASLKKDWEKFAPVKEEAIAMMVKTQYRGLDTNSRFKQLQKTAEVMGHERSLKQEAFIKAHPDSYVSLDLVKDRSSIIEPETFGPLYNGLSERMRNTTEGRKLADKFRKAQETGVGFAVKDFSMADSAGKMISLSSFKGKYVLLDFWASWCGPCRAENPNMLKAYNRFKDKNFDIMAVSIDERRNLWLKAVKDDNLPWTQVSDLLGSANKAAELYGISAIPQNFLIDPNGTIIARNLRAETLMTTLEKLIPGQ